MGCGGQARVVVLAAQDFSATAQREILSRTTLAPLRPADCSGGSSGTALGKSTVAWMPSSSQLPQKRAGVTMGQGLGVFFFLFFPFFPFFGWASVQAAEIRYFAP